MTDGFARTIPLVGRGRRGRASSIVLVAVLAISTATVVIGLVAAATLRPEAWDMNPYARVQFYLGFPLTLVGAFVAWREARHPLGWSLLAAGWLVWVSAGGWALLNHQTQDTLWVRVVFMASTSGWLVSRGIVQIVAPALYPLGWPRDRSRQVVVAMSMVVVAAGGVLQALVEGTLNFRTQSKPAWTRGLDPWLQACWKTMVVLSILALVDMVWRSIRSGEREALRHRCVAAAALVLAMPGVMQLAATAGWGDGIDSDMVWLWGSSLLVVAIAWGAVQHGALGFEAAVRRSALYVGVTVVAAVLYVLVVAVFAAVVRDGLGAGPLVATGVVAVSLFPARTLVQRGLDRWVFGDRDDPYRALSGLARRLEAPETEHDALAGVAGAARAALRLPYAAVEVDVLDPAVVVEDGERPGSVERFRLVHHGRPVGTLVVGVPAGEQALVPRDRAVLDDLARIGATVVHTTLLTRQLRESRDRLVRTREEERRRLRHDLHDGLGPTLASVALGLEAASTRLAGDDSLATLLRDLESELQAAITSIRQLVHGLRPPALDELGLVQALRQHARELSERSGDGGVHVEVDVEGDLGGLGAAVEAAAFRIAVEGMTNVMRHAGATWCTVRLRCADALEVSVEDDGRGVGTNRPGVGMESMRDRAEELGGRLLVTARRSGGTQVRAVLPLDTRQSA